MSVAPSQAAVVKQAPVPGEPAAPAFESMFREHAAFVWRVLRRFGVPESDAEDALQEVFLVVARRVEDYEDRGSTRAWLFTIARQIALHTARSEQRRAAGHSRLKTTPSAVAPLLSPEQQLEQKRAAELVQAMLSELSDGVAQAFVLVEVEGFTVPEVAAALGINLNTAYGRLRLARRHAERWLSRHEPEGEKR